VLATVRDTDEFKFNVNLVLIDLFLREGLIVGRAAATLLRGHWRLGGCRTRWLPAPGLPPSPSGGRRRDGDFRAPVGRPYLGRMARGLDRLRHLVSLPYGRR